MPAWLALFGMLVIGAVGVWTIAHPDDGYRAAGGIGSGLSPGARRACGVALVAFALLVGGLALLGEP